MPMNYELRQLGRATFPRYRSGGNQYSAIDDGDLDGDNAIPDRQDNKAIPRLPLSLSKYKSSDIKYNQIDGGGQKDPKSGSHLQGWRGTVAMGVFLTFLVLSLNVAVLSWTTANFAITGGVATLYTGSCSVTKTISIWSHLAINALGTILLGVSNNAMQCLSAPTRSEVDQAHSRGDWLDIGVPGTRNLWKISRRRLILWLFLGLSSVPLHLL